LVHFLVEAKYIWIKVKERAQNVHKGMKWVKKSITGKKDVMSGDCCSDTEEIDADLEKTTRRFPIVAFIVLKLGITGLLLLSYTLVCA
jgi:hypothetical protein